MLASRFASPTGDTSALLEGCFGNRLVRIVSSVMSSCTDHPDFPMLISFLESNVQLLEVGSAPFIPGIGHLLRPECDKAIAMLQIVLIVAAMGGHGQYRTTLANAGHVYVDCHFIPVSGSINGTFGNDRIVLEGARAEITSRTEFALRSRRWLRQDEPSLFFDSHGLSVFSFNHEIPATQQLPLTESFEISRSESAEIERSLEDAAAFIARNAPEYLNWIRPVLKGIVFVRKGDAVVSHSLPSCPGLLAISHPISVHKLAIQIIHEASHQYFYTLDHESSFSQSDSTSLYYSPLRPDPRPLGLVMLALHASLNICHFILHCHSNGELSDYLDDELRELSAGCIKCVEELRRSNEFTLAGNEFFLELDRMTARLLVPEHRV